ncbi:SPFH domain-containing protein [Olivibacter sitiensis]|uniref:SPFH domain-containing protein n=1 Tax=Olivibacter sitiensis TaxID=376470 RepID=UPI000408D480|nr:SPFH domain-containing protein [Olivibacter sitiensis]
MFQEKNLSAFSGYIALLIAVVCIVVGFVGIAYSNAFVVIASIVIFVLTVKGLVVVNPNYAYALILFGKYHGTIRQDGFFWVNPFYARSKVSLKARNLNGHKMKVNDLLGNPIEIAAVTVWQVKDSAKALFSVDNYVQYVEVQSEAAVRHLANLFAYDSFDDENHAITLKDGAEQVSHMLERELNERLERAGIDILEARITHLAYAPEIASAMLQRQQATAVVAARKQIVEGAVGMVEMALERLSEKQVVELDEERKASMVSNLLVVLCGEKSVSPVVNAGTLYP